MTTGKEETDKKISKRIESFLGNPLLYVVLFFVGSLIIAIFPDRNDQLKMYFLVAIALVASVGVYLGYQEWLSRKDYKEKFEKISKEKQKLEADLTQMNAELIRRPRVVLCKRVIKKCQILNMKGDARISYDLECVNGDNLLEKMEHIIINDGNPLKEGDVKVVLLGKPVPFEIETVARCKMEDSNLKVDRYESTLKINLRPPIKNKEPFTYGYQLNYGNVYSKLFQRENTSHRVMHETDTLEFHIIAPHGTRFARDWTIKVVDYNNVEDGVEEKVLSTNNAPRFLDDDAEILWEISRPKTTHTYYLYFRVLPPRKKQGT